MLLKGSLIVRGVSNNGRWCLSVILLGKKRQRDDISFIFVNDLVVSFINKICMPSAGFVRPLGHRAIIFIKHYYLLGTPSTNCLLFILIGDDDDDDDDDAT